MKAARLVLISALLAAGSMAQNVFWVSTGTPDRQLRGKGLTGIGDLNHDGYEDLIMIVDKRCQSGSDWEALWLLSGADGTLIRDVSSYANGVKFYAVTPAGDTNGDGAPDYASFQGGNTSTWCEVRSGANDAVLWSVPGIWRELLSDLDIDGDGQRDLIVGKFDNNIAGEVRAYSHGGTLRYTLLGGVAGPSHPPLTIGLCLAKLGDLDSDGCDDFVMGCAESMGRGAGVVVSGATGQYLHVCYGELPGDGIGLVASECGDMDGDGYQDFAMGNGGTPAVIRGVVRVFSGHTGQVLHQWTDPALGWADGMASRSVDFDGDGISDVAIGFYYYNSPLGTQGAIYAFSGRDGSQIGFLAGQPPQAGATGHVGNRFISTMRPRVGERIGHILSPNPDTLFTTTPTCQHYYGALVAYRGLPRTAVEFGNACIGNLANVPNIGMSSLGTSGVRIHLSNAPPNALAVLLIGLSTTQFCGAPLPMPLDNLGLPGCVLRTSIELMSTTVAGSVGVESGHAALDLAIPTPASGLGLWTVSAQWWVLGDASTFPGGMSQAVRWQH